MRGGERIHLRFIFKVSKITYFGFNYCLFNDLNQRPLFTRTGFQYIIPPFMMCLSIFLRYTNDSTLTLLKNSLFNFNK